MMFDIHDGEENDRERYVLGSSGANNLFVVGVNPGKANEDESDTTITKVGKFATNLKCDGFVMLHIYPQRATNPDKLHPNPIGKLVGKNAKVICSQVQGERQPQIRAAWGDLICCRNYLWDCLSSIVEKLNQFDPIWKQCGNQISWTVHLIQPGLHTRKSFAASIFSGI